METSILIVEPDETEAKLLERAVANNGTMIQRAREYESAIAELSRSRPDLVLSEMRLGDRTGIDLCAWLKRVPRTREIPLVFVSHAAGEMDRIAGLEAGATDYVAKPFSEAELLHRVEAIIRRTRVVRQNRAVMGRPVPNTRSRVQVRLNGRDITFLTYEHRILMALLESGGRVMTRAELIEAVWGPGTDISERTVDAHVKGIRRRLGGDRKILETVYRIGYRLRADLLK